MVKTFFVVLFGGVSTVASLLFFLLAARQNIWSWAVGGFYAVVSGGIMLMPSRFMPVSASTIYWATVHLLLFVYGALVWHKNGHRFFNQPTGKCYPVSSLFKQSYSMRKYVFLFLLAASFPLIALLAGGGVFSHLRIVIVALSLVLIADKKVEGWILLVIGWIPFEQFAENLPHSVMLIAAFIPKFAALVYGFVCWKSKLDKDEWIEPVSLKLMLKTGLLSVLYIVIAFVFPFVVTYLVCKGGSGCSGIPAGLFLGFFYFASSIIATIILVVKKEYFKQWQLFFLANGLFGVEVLRLLPVLGKLLPEILRAA